MILRSLSIVFGLCYIVVGGYAQSEDVRTHNRLLFDTLRQEFQTWCGRYRILPSSPHPAPKTKELTRWLRKLNTVFAEGPGETAILQTLRHLPEWKRIDSTEFGLMHEVVCTMYNDYLSVQARFTCLDGQILARRFELAPLTLRNCETYTDKIYDMDYLDQVYVPILNFPLRYISTQYLYSERLSPDAIHHAAVAYPQYRFSLPADTLSASINKMLTGQYYLTQWDHLDYNRVEPGFIDLVIAGDSRTLTTLLYSPHYFYAVSALQSLIYLENEGKFRFTPEWSQQIDRVRYAHFQIYIQHGDVLTPHDGYSDIKLADKWFIDQYRTAVKQRSAPSSNQ